MSTEVSSELKVTFFPPLYLQRRIWILDAIRRHQFKSILDIGCGEGELLNALRQPAPWLASHPDLTDDGKEDIASIHLAHLAGLDISDDIKFASQATAPPPDVTHEIRWEPLLVKIWKGGLEEFNPEFVGIECIVASEVIEHLPEHILSDFAPIVFGAYHPRICLLTTPSFTFNARFTAPDAPSTARKGYHDPTGRTSRIFRHEDHKFEWTVDEFEQWCDAVAKEWGYEFDISSVGMAIEIDEWGRDEDLGGASQVVEFRRLDDKDNAERRAKRSEKRVSNGTKHELFAIHSHAAHPQSQKPGSIQEIGDAVKSKMETSRETFMRLEEIWFKQDVAVLCGGWIELLVKAIEDHEKLVLHRHGTEKRTKWQVELIDGISGDLWLAEGENSVDYIPPDYLPEDDAKSESSGAEGDVSASSSDGESKYDSARSDGSWSVMGRTGREVEVSTISAESVWDLSREREVWGPVENDAPSSSWPDSERSS